MLVWVLRVDGVLAAAAALLLLTRVVSKRLVLPRAVYLLGAALGFCGWLGYLCTGGVMSLDQTGGPGFVWQEWLLVAPFALPLESGLLGWVALRSPWRWCFLAAGVLLLVIPVFLLPLLIR